MRVAAVFVLVAAVAADDAPEVQAALAAKRAGRLLEAIDGLRSHLAAHPDDWRAHQVLAWTYVSSNASAAATEHFRRVAELAPGTEAASEAAAAIARLEPAAAVTGPSTAAPVAATPKQSERPTNGWPWLFGVAAVAGLVRLVRARMTAAPRSAPETMPLFETHSGHTAERAAVVDSTSSGDCRPPATEGLATRQPTPGRTGGSERRQLSSVAWPRADSATGSVAATPEPRWLRDLTNKGPQRPAAERHSAALSARRQAAVSAAVESWTRRLIDPSRRNNLLYYRDLKSGTLDLTGSARQALHDLLDGRRTTLQRLVPADDLTREAAKLRQIGRKALANREERGLETLFVAYGMATWSTGEPGREPAAPVLLYPATVELKARTPDAASLQLSGEPQVNPVLLHALQVECGCSVSADELGAGASEESGAAQAALLFERLRSTTAAVPGFAIQDRVVLGNFSYQKMAIVQDLQVNQDALAGHDLIAAICGDVQARAALASGRDEVKARDLDRVQPDDEYLAFDSDASQKRVIYSVLSGQSGVVHGPPGTGKSQTIANLIGALAARGMRVLFVAEKRAALDVVRDRLGRAGLGHLVLDLHGADASRREVARQLATAIEDVEATLPPDCEQLHARLVGRRSTLNAHDQRLHSPRPPAGLSVYELLCRLAELPPDVGSRTRWRGAELASLTPATAEQIRDVLIEAGGFVELFLGRAESPWVEAKLSSGVEVQDALDAISALLSDHIPSVAEEAALIGTAIDAPPPTSFEAAQRMPALVNDLAAVRAGYHNEAELLQAVYLDGVLALPLDQVIEALLLVEVGRRTEWWLRLTSRRFRDARRRMISVRRNGSASAWQLLSEAREIAGFARRWFEETGALNVPEQPPDATALTAALDQARLASDRLDELCGGTRVWTDEWPTVRSHLAALLADGDTARLVPRCRELQRTLERFHVDRLNNDLASTDPAGWTAVFDHAWLSSCLEEARARDNQLAGFSGQAHDRVVADFREYDRQHWRLARERIRRAHAERVVATMNRYPEQTAVVRREAAKRARHLPLRKLLTEAPDLVTVLCPCWMASPLSVSQLLDAQRAYFDVVLFDEASQILPEDAAPSLLRARQAVVAGDHLQLPPTTFFTAGGEEDLEVEEAGATEGFESLLDLMLAFSSRWTLDWHYRSRDESLIAFSNRHIYADRLVTFPSVGHEPAIAHVLVEQKAGIDGQEHSCSAEVLRVVELILDHARTRSNETLGVIAMGIEHARRLEMALDDALRCEPTADGFFDEDREERFFIKNLERVQGDERDAIILSVGYGKDRAGRLLYRFGPLNNKGGERRLNVAVTRARKRLTLVSSFGHHDMDPARTRARGAELLRLYLQYADSGGARLGDGGAAEVPLNPFEADIYATLTAAGIPLKPQWGASRYRIDMVAAHPTRPGQFVLAIECDGASYHSSPTARDRDRLRQEHLESLGWRFHRIWSLDWFRCREKEIQRAMTAYEHAVAAADRPVSRLDAEPAHQAPADPDPPSPSSRRPRPPVPRRATIDDYTSSELDRLLAWVQSDGRLRTDEQLIDEMVAELGFSRRGRRIVAAIEKAVGRAKRVRR